MHEESATTVDPVDEAPEDVIAARLGPREKLLWAGRPPLGLVLRAQDIVAIAVVCVVAVSFGGMAFSIRMASGSKLFAVLLGLAAFYQCFVRFFVDMRHRECVFYGVTSERVIIVYGVFRRRAKSLSLDTLSQCSLSERRNGGGSIQFGANSPSPLFVVRGICAPRPNPALSRFELASDARRVYELIRTAQRQAKPPSTAPAVERGQ